MNKNKLLWIRSIFLIIVVVCLIILSNKHDVSDGFKFGNKYAPIKIVEYSSFQCGTCKKVHDEIGYELKKYIDKGLVEYTLKVVDIERFEYDDVIFKHINELDCKNIEKINEIFKTQDKWKVLNSKEDVIKTLNLDEEQNEKHLDEYLWRKDVLLEMNIRNLPAIFINGEKIDYSVTKEEFINIIERELLKNN